MMMKIIMAARSFKVSKSTEVSGRWIPIVLSEFSEIRNVIVEITRINVSCNNSTLSCPWIAKWNGSLLMKTLCRLSDHIIVSQENFPCGKEISRVHGITGLDEGFNMSHLSSTTLNNIRQYFLSDLHITYAAARSLVLEKGSLRDCLDKSDIVSLHTDMRQTDDKKTECLVVLEKEAQCKSNAISQYLFCLLHNRSARSLLQTFSHNQVQFLQSSCKHVDASTFPIVQYKDSRPQHLLVPLEGIEKTMDFFHDIESESNLYYIDAKSKPIVVFLYVPHHAEVPLTYVCEVDVVYHSLGDPILSGPPEHEQGDPFFNHPLLLSLSQAICGEKDLDMMENNLGLFKDMSHTYKK